MFLSQKTWTKLFIFSGFFFGVFQRAVVALTEEPTRAMTKVITSGVSFNQQIASSSINNSLLARTNGGQFVITKSGRYFLSTDVVSNPVTTAPVILINTSDVFIDLGGKTLTVTYSNTLPHLVGIKVAPGMRNITICNGTICGSSSDASFSGKRAFYQAVEVGDSTGVNTAACANIIFDSVIITSCARYGVGMYNCQNIVVNGVTVQGIMDGGETRSSATTIQKAGMHLYKCADAEFVNSNFNGVTLSTGYSAGDFAVGLNIEKCRNIKCKNVSVTANRAFSAGSAIGLRLHATTGSCFEELYAVGNRTSSMLSGDTFVAGVLVQSDGLSNEQSSGNIFKQCFFNENTSNSLSTTTTAYGLRITQSCNSSLLMNCTASNNAGILGCGYSLFSAKNNTFKECIATGNTSYGNHTFSQARGFSFEFGIGNMLKNCEARGNTTEYVSVTGPASFLTAPFSNPSVSGVYFRSEQYSGVKDSVIASNYGSETLGHIAYGIAYHGACRSCVVTFSEMDSNKAQYCYGFKDFKFPSTTLLRGNVSFAHGQCFTGGHSSFIDVGKHNYMIQYDSANGSMDVQNLVKEADIANMNAFEAGSTKWFNFSILETAISG